MENEVKRQNGFIRFLIGLGKFLLDILLRIVFTFRDLGISIWHGIKGIGRMFVKMFRRFKASDLWTKIGHLVMGTGNFARKQYVKGAIFLAIEILFIMFMISSPAIKTAEGEVPTGAKAVANFFTLGDDLGMPITRVELEVTDAPLPGDRDVDLHDTTNNNGQINQAKRSLNLVKEVVSGSVSSNFQVVENDHKHSVTVNGQTHDVYRDEYIKELILDNRYGTNDVYGLVEYEGGDDISVSTGATLLILVSDHKIGNFGGVVEYDNVTASSTTVYGYTGEDFGNKYVYLLFAKVQASPFGGSTAKLDKDVLGASEIYRIVLDTNAYNSNVDNSFLMMLFGIISFVLIALFLVVWNLSISSSCKAVADIEEGKKPSTFVEDLKSLLDGRFHIALLTPAIILLLIFTIIPTILMILIAFTDMSESTMMAGSRLITWRGFANFADLFSQGSGSKIATEVGKNFGGVLIWTFEWAIIATFSCYFGGIFLALLLNRKDVKMKKMWRTIFILTIAIPQFITFLILRNMLTNSGPINSLFGTQIDFLQTGSGQLTGTSVDSGRIWLARASVLVINLYVGIPYTMLMTSGILMNIPADLYEAATIDGANKWQMFRKITLPYIIFVTTPYLISSFIGNITSFNTIFLTTGGGPAVEGSIAGKTDLLVTWLYKMTINESIYNAGSIIGILTFIITAFITLVAYRNSKAYKEEDTFQ